MSKGVGRDLRVQAVQSRACYGWSVTTRFKIPDMLMTVRPGHYAVLHGSYAARKTGYQACRWSQAAL